MGLGFCTCDLRDPDSKFPRSVCDPILLGQQLSQPIQQQDRRSDPVSSEISINSPLQLTWISNSLLFPSLLERKESRWLINILIIIMRFYTSHFVTFSVNFNIYFGYGSNLRHSREFIPWVISEIQPFFF